MGHLTQPHLGQNVHNTIHTYTKLAINLCNFTSCFWDSLSSRSNGFRSSCLDQNLLELLQNWMMVKRIVQNLWLTISMNLETWDYNILLGVHQRSSAFISEGTSDRFWTTMPLHISPDEYTPYLQQYSVLSGVLWST